MRNLFKEVWRSLFKNKIIVGGLTILIFLTSGIFTFLHGSTKTMQIQYEKYQNQSKAHDITVDLNLPINGNTYNNGYFINGLSREDDSPDYNKPIKYLTKNYLETSNILNFNKITEQYLPLSYFIDQQEYQNRYISRSDFLDLYNSSNGDNQQGELFALDYSQNQKYFKLKRPITFQTYVKEGDNYKQEIAKTSVAKENRFRFDKVYKFKDIAYIYNSEKNDIYVSQLSTLYINPENNLMTFDILQGRDWEANKGVVKISGDQLAKLLGLTPLNNNNNYVYVINKEIKPVLINYTDGDDFTDLYSKELLRSFAYDNLFNNKDIEVEYNGKITFENDKLYNIPLNWAYQRNKITYFERKLYETTYVGETKNKWSGTYKSFMDNLITQFGNIPQDYAKFSFWEKTIVNEYIPYINQNNLSILGEIETKNEEKNLLSYEEVQNTLLKLGENQIQPRGIDYSKFAYDGYQGIAQIEGYTLIDNKNYLNLTNRNIASDTLLKIRSGALEITKQNIYRYLERKVSKENIGIRQSITVDSFNDGEGKKVYHFVNVGDQNKTIYGIQNNINKLINEDLYPTLNKESSDLTNYFVAKELNPYVSSAILTQALSNIIPSEEYIKLDYEYNRVQFTDSQSGQVTDIPRTKIYKLTNYKNNKTLPDNEYNVFADLGVMLLSNDSKFVILKPFYNEQNQIVSWKNVELNIDRNGIVPNGQMYNWLSSNKLTLKSYLPKNTFVMEVPDFNHTVFVPFEFRGPDVEVVNQALNENSLDYGINKLWKSIINTDLYKKGFINEEQLLVLMSSLKKSFDKNNFAQIFSSGSINYSVLPKIILDGLYEVSNHPQGDYIKIIINNVFNKVLGLLSNFNTQEEKNNYLAKNIDNLFSFIALLSGDKIVNYDTLSSMMKASKNLDEFLIILRDIFSAINFKKIFGYTNHFFNTDYNKEHKLNGQIYKRGLSIYDILLAVLNGIEYPILKDALIRLLDNLDINYLTDWDNPNNPLQGILDILPFGVKELLPQINAKENDTNKKYQNLINGIKFLINNFDHKIFLNTLKEEIELEATTVTQVLFNKLLGTDVESKKNILITNLDSKKITYAIIKSMFSIPGSDRRVKDEIIKMLNLSSKGTNIKISDGQYLSIPDKDPDKLDFFDLIGLLAPIDTASSRLSSNTNSKNQLNASLTTLQLVKRLVDQITANKDLLTKELLQNVHKNVLKEFFELNNLNDLNNQKEQVLQKAKEWKIILDSMEITNEPSDSKVRESFGNLTSWFINLQPKSSSNFFNIIITRILSQLTPAKYSEFNYLTDVLPLIRLWLEIFNNTEDHARNLSFANALLEIGNKQEIIDSFNSFDLFQSGVLNIAGYQETGFGVTRSLANTTSMNEYFFRKENSGYANTYLRKLVNDYPDFEKFIEQNSYLITQNFSYIAATNKDFVIQTGGVFEHSNPLSSYISIFINTFLNNPAFKNNLKTLTKTLITDYKRFSLDALGISDVLLNNILRRMFPQLLVWTFTNSVASNEDATVDSNIASFIYNKLVNFENLVKNRDNFISFLSKFDSSGRISPYLESDYTLKIAIDNNIFTKLSDLVAEDPEKYSFFGMDLSSILFASINSITGLTPVNNVLTFNRPESYIAKVNYAFLNQNNKEIYSGKIPDDAIEAEALLKTLDERYLININGTKFIIIGEDITFDYFYPVLDENNLQVNTKDQAVVYVNNSGFDRIRQSYRGTVVKEYLTLKQNPTLNSSSLNELKLEIEKYVQNQINDVASLQRTFLYNELDPINPERSLRIGTIEKLINSVSTTSNFILIILITLVSISTTFIIKRYISNKNKVIGILIAQGYTPLQISLSLCIFAIFTIFTGGLLGYITGFLLTGYGLQILSNYWVIPIETLTFEPVSLITSLALPLFGMSLLIVLVALRSLRYKAIDLMSGITSLSISEFYNKLLHKTRNKKVTTKFGISLIYNSFWKLFSFGITVVLSSITTIIGISTFGTFETAVEKTYSNRKYNYKLDLVTPTTQGGLYNPALAKDLENTLYVPVGDIRELNQYQPDYFKPGASSAVNLNDPDTGKAKNGNPSDFHPHVITQFSVNIKIESSVSIDPFQVIYNSLPDSQKSRILQLRDNVGFNLMKHQEGVAFVMETDKNGKQVNTNTIDINKTLENGVRAFFQYIPNKDNIIDGKFYYVAYNDVEKQWEHKNITTTAYRDQYRQFLVNGYKWMDINTEVRDYFVLFNGIVFNNTTNETYTYLESNYKENDIKIYGYQSNSNQINIYSESGENLLSAIDNQYKSEGSDSSKAIPLIINNVVKSKYNLSKGDILELTIKNKVNRLTKNIEEKLGRDSYLNTEKDLNKTYKFYVYGINPTFINNEFIIPKAAADQIIGFDALYKDKLSKTEDSLPEGLNEHHYKFNGILSKDQLPIQLMLSTGLYSPSGFFGAIESFNIDNTGIREKKDFFDAIFGNFTVNPNLPVEGVMKQLGASNDEIVKFLNPNYNPERDNFITVYNEAKEAPDLHIKEFAKLFNEQLAIPSSYTVESKTIEISFALSIGKTVQIILTIISAFSFILSIIILIIVSTILINENERNIAIWSILGYSNKEKIKMFFGIYVPFIIISLILAFPIAYGIISIFGIFLATSVSLSIPLTISWFNLLLTITVVSGVFGLTSAAAWINLNKIKAIDLLKEK